MKILFFLTLLINLTLFFWSFNSKTSERDVAQDPKQIFLLSELPKIRNKNNLHTTSVSQTKKSDVVIAKPKVADKKIESEALASTNIADIQVNKDKVSETITAEQAVKTAVTPLKTTILQDSPIVASTSKQEKPKKDKSVANEELCYHIGPFKNMGQLRIWTRANKIKEGSFSHINKGTNKGSKYLVYIPAANAPEQTKKDIVELEQRGIKDYWLFRRGDLKGAISLGVFVKEKRALLQQNQLRKKGLELKITPLYGDGAIIFAKFLTKNKGFKQSLVMSGKQKVKECQ
jgi:hypothetical protein